ncbi:MAG: ATP-dependent DNA helicase [Chromatiaceae bacterium]|nr:ATP-dependent DNA helicase [Chromatiaceae bacterium]MCP5436836.1 ATP-dependent DNA helicase [Chromatiaceae bacterium]MCP5441116.1 ATP-dependent DNA helicase [Chromatiaceae bacterium]
MMEIAEVLGPDGLLARSIDGFAYRSQQLDMAEAVADALEQGGTLIAEAGTGTGKTFAYLVPALLSGQKVIISTGTRNLQDQLFLRDLPRLREAMASPARVALLKGRANYLCIHRMESAMLDARGHRREDLRWLLKVRDWSARTDRGDISELGDVPEDAAIWPLVTSTTDNCLGQECSDWSRCHLVEARRRAQEADVVVVNHHLLCADFALKGDGFGELLPAADAFLIDEAHQLPEVASNFFGTTVSTRQILDLMRDTQAEYHREAGDLPKLLEQLDVVSKAARDLRLAFGQALRRGPWNEIENDAEVTQALCDCRERLGDLHGMLEAIQGRGKGLDACLARCEGLGRQIDELVSPEQEADAIRWFETHPQSLRLNSTPLDVADVFRLQMQRHPAAWIFTSATLAVGDSFEHFQRQLGLDDALTCKWDSPFDYPNQALWYVPRGMPQPSDPGYTRAVVDLVLPIVEASAGRAFLLFTSHRALREAADLLHEHLTFPLLVQGNAPKAELLERFVEHGNAVLLGTASFWEGVDVRGEALSVVVIDKLPFASPGDPVLQARLDAVRRHGGNPFMQHQVPQAAIALKQGAGRLIRDVTDRGVLVLCDPRLLKKGYGQVFLDAMPPFARTRELEQVLAFFR